MKRVTVSLESISPYSQSAFVKTARLNKETHDDFEKRTWRDKCSTDESGTICIPAMALKQALDAAAKLRGDQIPGKGKSTYTKHFRAGVISESDVSLGIAKADVASIDILANADGVRGSGKRVHRIFPLIPTWRGEARFAILDDTITKEVFERHLGDAGLFIGIGRFRPENGGMNGRFKPTAFRWSAV